ncbi:AMP-binding protein [Halorutilales archaeon Cl-col2-1]
MLEGMDLSGVESYEEAREEFEWEIPDKFNMGTAAIDQHADDRGRVAHFWENKYGENETWTFWQFQKRANQYGNALDDLGITQDDVVAVHVPQQPETIIAHTGTWRYGAISLPLAYTFEKDGIRYRLNDSETKAIVVHETKMDTIREIKDDVDSLEHILIVGDGEPQDDDEILFNDYLDEKSTEFEPADTTPEDDCLLMYTSGTTGDPKGVLHGHRILIGHLPGFQMLHNMEMEGVYYTPADWAWAGGMFDCLVPALFYGQPVVGTNLGKFIPEQQYELMEKFGISHGFVPPTALNMLRQEDDDPYDLELEFIVSGGESLTPEALEWGQERGIHINELYGQTEANLLVGNCDKLWDVKPGSMGLPFPGHEVEVIDQDTLEPCEPRELGEIALKADDPVKFKKYINKPEKTEEVHEGDWYLTGDLAEKDEDGFIWFQSRDDDLIISSGYRIGPVEVENEIMEVEEVAEVAVVGIPDEVRGNIVKAYVQVADGAEPSDGLREKIQDHVKNNLAKHEYPRELDFVDEFPKTATGKIRRKTLRDREIEKQQD